MPTLKANRKVPKKKPSAKKPWKGAPSKRSVISATKKNKQDSTSAPVKIILDKLQELYPDAHCALIFSNPFELLVATALSAQCTDVAVNKATPGLFKKYPTPEKMSKASEKEIYELIKTINFANTKAKNLKKLSQGLLDLYQGKVPKTIDELVLLAGVGRKTANVVLGNAFEITSGIVVDTHVGRLSQRLGWSQAQDATKIEQDLLKIIPEGRWIKISHELIFHGRQVCKSRAPLCAECGLNFHCPKNGVAPDED